MVHPDYIQAYKDKDFARLKELVEQGFVDNDLDAIVDLIEEEVEAIIKERK